MPKIQKLVEGQVMPVWFRLERSSESFIPRVHQFDGHSCGFLAALPVIRHFNHKVETNDVLAIMRPSPEKGCSDRQMIKALSHFGVTAKYKERLGWNRLSGLIKRGNLLLVTIQPPEWVCDHWTVIRGLADNPKRVLLSNPAPRGDEYDNLAKDGSVPWNVFSGRLWQPRGGALVCRQKVQKTNTRLYKERREQCY